MTRVCNTCQTEKLETDFPFSSGYRRRRCSTCQSAYTRDWVKRNRDHCNQHQNEYWRARPKQLAAHQHAAYLRNAEARKLEMKGRRSVNRDKINLLKAAPCVDCGCTYPSEAMDFDHVRGTKAFTIGSYSTRNWDVVLAEVAKCDLVCANCHRVRTKQRKSRRNKLSGRTEFMRGLKLSCGCAKCANVLPSECLDFHHRNPDDKEQEHTILNIYGPWWIRFNTLVDELNKCDVLCAVCHRLEHLEMKQWQ